MKINEIHNAFDLVQALGLSRNKGEEFLELCKQNDIASLALFGSFSRGEGKKDSDLDLLVTFSRGKSLIDHIRTENAFEKLLEIKVDMITERSLNKHLAPIIKKDLKRLL